MPNYYTSATAEKAIPCTQLEFETFRRILGSSDEDADYFHGFECEQHGEEIYFFSEEETSEDVLPDEFFDALGQLLTRLSLPHLEFGVSYSCSKNAPGSCGGSSFRIMANGSLVYEQRTWPDGQ